MLSHAGRLALLPALYERIVIPPAVRDDAIRRGVSAADIDQARWLSVRPPLDSSMVEQLLHVEGLDLGESEAIVLAMQLGLRLLIDERQGDRVARKHGIVVTGVVGVVLAACRMQIITVDEVEPLLRRMAGADFWLSEGLIRHAVALAREGN